MARQPKHSRTSANSPPQVKKFLTRNRSPTLTTKARPHDPKITQSIKTLVAAGLTVLRKRSTVNFLTGLRMRLGQSGSRDRGATTANLKLIRLNWSAIAASFDLSFGDVHVSGIWRPNNRGIVRRLIHTLRDMIQNPIETIKRLDLGLRLKSLGLPSPGIGNRGKTPKALFLAGTLARALTGVKVEKSQINNEIESAFHRITAKTPMPSKELLSELGTFIDDLFKNVKVPGNEVLPMPQLKACLEYTAQEGGALRVLDGLRIGDEEWESIDKTWREATRDAVLSKFTDWGSIEEEDETGQFRDLNVDLDDCDEIAEQICDAIAKGCPYSRTITLSELFRRSLQKANSLETSRSVILPIVQRDGKIRVATMHSMHTTWIARAMTSFLMPKLKRLFVTRDMLRGNDTFSLRNTAPNTLVYSADFAKSTDPISIELSRFVLERIGNVTNAPSWWSQAVSGVIRSFTIAGGPWLSRTECGALMGLGPGWTVLCVLNAFAAHRAGARKYDHRICGDDLVGLWTYDTILSYRDTIAALGLVLNHKKSFISPVAGVFCERLGIRSFDIANVPIVRFPSLIRIGEAVGTRATENGQGKAAVDGLLRISKDSRVHKVLRRAAYLTASRQSFSNFPGSYHQGGASTKNPDHIAVVAYALYGPTPLFRSEQDPVIQDLRRGLRSYPTTSNGVPRRSVLTSAEAEIERTSRIQAKAHAREPLYTDHHTLMRILINRRTTAKRLIRSCGGPMAAIRCVMNDKMKDPYVLVSKSLEKKVCSSLRRRSFVKAIKLMAASWLKPISPDHAHQAFTAALPSAQAPTSLRTLEPAPKVWGSTRAKLN